MNELTKVFDYNQKQVRTVVKDGEPWFVAKDVCEVLELVRQQDSTRYLDEDEKRECLLNTPGGNQEMVIVSESGLYSLILKSRKPEAKQFKRWITHEVIPSIRKNGAYMTPITLESAISNPDFAIGLLTNLKEEQEKRRSLESKMKEDEPFTIFGKSIATSNDSINLGTFAKLINNAGIKLGRNKFIEWLRNNGYLMRTPGEWNDPRQQYVNQGIFSVREALITTSAGSEIRRTTLVTGKGQEYLMAKIKEELQ